MKKKVITIVLLILFGILFVFTLTFTFVNVPQTYWNYLAALATILSTFIAVEALSISKSSIIEANRANVLSLKNLIDSQLMRYADTINSIVSFDKFVPKDLQPGELSKLLTYLIYSFETIEYFRSSSSLKTVTLVNETEQQFVKERKDLFYIQLNSTIKGFLKNKENIDNLKKSDSEEQSKKFKKQYLSIIEYYKNQIYSL